MKLPEVSFSLKPRPWTWRQRWIPAQKRRRNDEQWLSTITIGLKVNSIAGPLLPRQGGVDS
ncbi:MAG: hypothetical protein ABSG91_05585 [Syntrophobacteraceae bacterium]|jgi:hypothetical protein